LKNALSEFIQVIKKEAIPLAAAFILLDVLLTLGFYRDNILGTLRMSASLLWLFSLPGYAFLLGWHDSLGFFERIVAGTLLGAGTIGILSYYAGIMGLNVNTHALLLAPLLFALGLLWSCWVRKKKRITSTAQ
jgi:hypothetical protein